MLSIGSRRECVLVHDAPWKGNGCDFHNIVKDGNLYRMYYLGWWMLEKGKGKDVYVCYAERTDGLHWTKPSLGLFEYKGSKDNNIILTKEYHGSHIDNFMVFIDSNPACPADERYKAVCFFFNQETKHPELHSYVSSDGVRFKKAISSPIRASSTPSTSPSGIKLPANTAAIFAPSITSPQAAT